MFLGDLSLLFGQVAFDGDESPHQTRLRQCFRIQPVPQEIRLARAERGQEWDCGRLDHECDGAKCGNHLRTSEAYRCRTNAFLKALLVRKYQ